MPLQLYDTLSRREHPFTPLEPPQVRMYCCGVTVYDYCHLGHARSYIVWDIVRRYLTWCGYQVRYVQNFTDIDDKILNRARQESSSMEEVANRFTDAYFEDMARLNVMEADEYPRATHTLDGIQRLIHELENKGFAYAADGDVYYRVQQFENYGKLSHRQLAEMEAGRSDRVASQQLEKKENPFDFALWKSAKPGEPSWPSNWGKGRPGWHIECSAMVRDRLGDSIDIHCGGSDLVFPHHENEIAQSEAVTGKSLAKYWMHNGMVTVNGEKMSKSLGNFTTIRELLKTVEPMALRLFVLQVQYRNPLDFTDAAIASATNGWQTLKEGLTFGTQYGDRLGWKITETRDRDILETEAIDRFQTAMDSDFNTPGALAVLFELAKELRREGNVLAHGESLKKPPDILERKWHTLAHLAGILGLQVENDAETSDTGGVSEAEIEAAIGQRKAARAAKNFAEADRIRNELATQGVTLVDRPGGETIWHR